MASALERRTGSTADDRRDPDAPPRVPDLRMPLLAAAAWSGSLAGLLVAPVVLLGVGAVGAVGVVGVGGLVLLGARRTAPARAGHPPTQQVRALRRLGRRTTAAVLLVAVAAATVAAVHRASVGTGPVAALAEQQAGVRGELVVTADPRLRQGQFSDYVVLRGRLEQVTGRGRSYDVASPVLVVAEPAWAEVELGSRLQVAGRLAPADGGDLAGMFRARGEPVVIEPPDGWWDAAATVRAALRASVDHRPDDQAVLVPSLVVGDDAGLDPDLSADFATTGLTHLLAVSGTNLTLIVGFLLVIARWVGVRGRGLHVVAALGIVGFVLLARTEPSVVRAAAMGTIGLIGMGRNGRERGTRGLGAAVVVLLLLQPWLALTAGFALSVLATAGILFLAPGWRDALATWMPRWLAEAVAVPAAAQLACTPLVAGLSGEVSIVAVVANMAVAPVVGPATVLGLAGGLVGVVWTDLSRVPGTLASWCVAWIIAVARWGAALPVASVGWGTSGLAVAALAVACLAVVPVAPRVLRSRVAVVVVCLVAGLVVVVRPPTPGWPPDGWVVVACDVGQGDALVLRAGPGSAVVVDVGVEPAAVDRCLDDLGVTQVPLVVLSHFHDDHVGGFEGVLDGRAVGAVDISPLAEPAWAAEEVARAAADAGVTTSVPAYGGRRQVGDVVLEVLWPLPGAYDGPAAGGAGEEGGRDGEGSGANDASLVVLAEVRGVSVLLTGDVEPPAQRGLVRELAVAGRTLDVDVLKMPHHGSRHQFTDLLVGVGAEVALVSVGADNTYGHPSPDALLPLEATGVRVLRTDLSGDLAVTERDGRVGTAVRRR